MARGKRSVETAAFDAGNIVDGPISEIAAEPDSSGGGSEPAVSEFTDPITATGTDGSSLGEQPKRGRGRPRGSKNTREKETVRTVGADGVAGILLTIHSVLAVIARAPELELSEDEAAKIAKASISVAKLYNVETTDKATAWMNLIGVAGAIYVQRGISMSVRWKMEADAKRQGATVTQFPGHPMGPSAPNHANGGMRPN